ncbi:hypothetical protein [Shinella zoogloeoides]|uniref:Uncharacterized protein n=1 Tax=Shinella zoogloeoides TaxID=352475 RepID=A0A6N8TE81_SHIZO|nr:hypothetical protein [Shinella zoogloeoides]MXN99419.1 hypothetical protein [Shinella zoogloeoides]UEX82802.1 hypothetical protein K8M09_05850 [Shinella zoogloeoides]
MSDTAEFWHSRCGELLCLIEDLKEFDANAFDAPDNEKIDEIDKLWKAGLTPESSRLPRYAMIFDGEEGWTMLPDPDGEYVKFEDVASEPKGGNHG